MNKINLTNPLNNKHTLTRGLLNAYFGLPQWMDGRTWFDLRRTSNGVLTNAATIGTTSGSGSSYRPNAIKEMRLDGTDDLITLNKVISHGFGDFTFGIWFRANDFSATRILQGYSVDSGNTFIGHLGSNTVISARDSGATIFNWTVPAMSANIWYHLVVARISGQIRCYLNGTESVTGAISSTGTFNTDIIGYAYLPSSSWNGAVDAITIYGRGLSAGEIRGLYKETQKGCPNLFNRVTPPRVYTTGSMTIPKNMFKLKPRSINLTHPLNKKHPLFKGLVFLYSTLPQWTGGNTWFDLCRNYNGTLNNVTTTSGWRATKRPGGKGELRFDGTDDYVDCGTIPSTASYSFGGWVLPTINPQSLYARIGETSYSGWFFLGADQNGTAWSYWNVGNQITGGTVQANVWTHIFGTYDGVTQQQTLYINGVAITTGTSTPPSGSYSLLIGKQNGAPSSYWTGSLDNLALYNRALTAGEVSALYKETKAGCPTLFNRPKVLRQVTYYTGLSQTSFNKPNKALINITHPLNKKHILAKGLVEAWVGLSQWLNGRSWFGICRTNNVQTLVGVPAPRPLYSSSNLKALSCDGSTQYSTSTKNNFPVPGNSFSVGCYALISGTGAKFRIFDRWYHWSIFQASGSTLNCEIYIKTISTNNYMSVSSSITPTLNTWYHLFLTYDGTTLTFYINNVAVGSTTTVSSVGSPQLGTVVAIGTGINEGTGLPASPLNGSVHSAWIYNRSLSASEISLHYSETLKQYPTLFRRISKNVSLSLQTPTPTITASKPVKLNITHPVNKKHALSIGLKSWWLALPQWAGGATWFDLCRRYNVTLDNTVRWQASYRPGNNRCLNFSTSSGAIGNMGTFSKLTIAMWVRLDVTHGWSISTSLAQGILLDNAQFRYRGFGVDYSTFPTISGNWQNIVVTADSVNINLYMNGIFLGSTAQTNSTEAFSSVTLGNKGDGSESFIGLMDDIRIYDRALGSGEVTALYNNSKEKYKGLLKRVNNFGRIQNSSNVITYAPSLFFSYL